MVTAMHYSGGVTMTASLGKFRSLCPGCGLPQRLDVAPIDGRVCIAAHESPTRGTAATLCGGSGADAWPHVDRWINERRGLADAEFQRLCERGSALREELARNAEDGARVVAELHRLDALREAVEAARRGGR